MPQRIGIDIGGTFTDLVATTSRRTRDHAQDRTSTPRDYGEEIIDGLRALLDPHSGMVADVLHGTTIRLQYDPGGQRRTHCADHDEGLSRPYLEIRDLRMPVLCDLHWTKAARAG